MRCHSEISSRAAHGDHHHHQQWPRSTRRRHTSPPANFLYWPTLYPALPTATTTTTSSGLAPPAADTPHLRPIFFTGLPSTLRCPGPSHPQSLSVPANLRPWTGPWPWSTCYRGATWATSPLFSIFSFFPFRFSHIPTTTPPPKRSVDHIRSATRRSVVVVQSRAVPFSQADLFSGFLFGESSPAAETNLPPYAAFALERFSPRLQTSLCANPQKHFLHSGGTTLESRLTYGCCLESPLRPSCRIRSLSRIESVLQAPVFEPHLDPKICLITIINNGQPPGNPHGNSRHRQLVLVRWQGRDHAFEHIN